MNSMVQPAGWQATNAAGVSHAESSEWTQATEAFEHAAAALGIDESDDARALLLSNLASAHFHAGNVDAALASARASLEVRERLWKSSIATARAKSDLATILCARGEHEIAHALLNDAIESVARLEGDDAIQLVPFVENAARAAIAARDMARAEPLVLRLHALLDAHELSVHDADMLFRFVIEARSTSVVQEAETVPDEAVAMEVEFAPEEADTMEVESVPEEAVMTEVVLVPDTAVTTEAVSVQEDSHADADVIVFTTSEHAIAEMVAEDAGDGSPDVELTDSFTALELVEPPPPTLDQVPEERRHVHRDDDSLGFLVQHGTTVTPDEPFDVLSGPIGPLPELARQVTTAADEAAASTRLSGDIAAVAPAPPAGRPLRVTQPMALQTRGIQVRRPSRDVPVVLPSPSRTSVASPEFAGSDDVAPRNSLRVPAVSEAANAASAVAARPVLLDHPRVRASGGARVWLVVGGGLASLAAAIGWYLA